MTRSIEIQIEGLTSDLIRMVMETYGWDFARAMDEVYKSETFKRMCNPNTGMYYQSPVYVFDFLKNEIETGIMS